MLWSKKKKKSYVRFRSSILSNQGLYIIRKHDTDMGMSLTSK